MVLPLTRPVQSGPILWGQILRNAWKVPFTLNTPIPARPRNGTTILRSPGGISSTLATVTRFTYVYL